MIGNILKLLNGLSFLILNYSLFTINYSLIKRQQLLNGLTAIAQTGHFMLAT